MDIIPIKKFHWDETEYYVRNSINIKKMKSLVKYELPINPYFWWKIWGINHSITQQSSLFVIAQYQCYQQYIKIQQWPSYNHGYYTSHI